MPKLQGPGPLILDGKVYQVGDNVPMNKESADHHARNGVIWVADEVNPKEQAEAAAAAVGLNLKGEPLPVHPVTGVPAPVETFPKSVPPTAKTSVSPTLPTPGTTPTP